MTNGRTYTEHLAKIDEILGRMDERQQAIQADITEIKVTVIKNADKNAEQDAAIAVLSARQKILGGGVVAVAGTLATAVVKWVTG